MPLALASKSTLVAALFVSFVAPACDGGSPDRQNEMAKALDNSKVGGNADKAAHAAGMKKLKEKADEDSKAAHAKELETITAVAAPLPADLDAACAEAAAGLDAFMAKRLTGDDLGRWTATKEPDLRKATESCKEAGKIEVGACLGKAYANASLAEFANGSQGEIKTECYERYGAALPGDPKAEPEADAKAEPVKNAGIAPG